MFSLVRRASSASCPEGRATSSPSLLLAESTPASSSEDELPTSSKPSLPERDPDAALPPATLEAAMPVLTALAASSSASALPARSTHVTTGLLLARFPRRRRRSAARACRGLRLSLSTRHSPVTCFTTSSLSPFTEYRAWLTTPRLIVSSRPRMRLWYSAKLLVCLPRYLEMVNFTVPSLLRSAPAPEGPGLPWDAPSKKISKSPMTLQEIRCGTQKLEGGGGGGVRMEGWGSKVSHDFRRSDPERRSWRWEEDV
mmetsp:Transcript_56746/g.179383  ORF Transcript_56746/g.179383 Transcript_56746/m.179383 type:complete len:255 (-) Transcript_56746:152-916(-)